MAYVRYFGGLWMTFNEELQGQISACLQGTYIYVLYTQSDKTECLIRPTLFYLVPSLNKKSLTHSFQ